MSPIAMRSNKSMHILIAPNAFKHALSADRVAAAILRGLGRSRLPATIETFPVADGGDGTGDLLIRHLGGQQVPAVVTDPFGRKIKTYWGLAERMAIIEMANASGLRLLGSDEPNPFRASSAGTGELIAAALGHGVETVVVGMGGSATVDGGTGILQVLGARFLDVEGQMLKNLPAELTELESIDMSTVDRRLAGTEFIVLCDVDNPLTGPKGAAAVFGPQKGASPAAVPRLEAGLRQLALVIARQTGLDIAALPRGGTAGGSAGGLHALLSARLVSGIEYFLDITHFNNSLERSSLVITGEGSIDEQTLDGKAPFGVALRARTRNVPVIVFTGKIAADPDILHPYFDEIIPISPSNISLTEALAATATNLERTATEWGNRQAGAL